MKNLIVILWRWRDGTAHAGGRFWAVHDPEADGRVESWMPSTEPLGAAIVTVHEGEGLELLNRFKAADSPQGGSD